MPEQEFEIYLSLLSRLLRLSPAQKATIADELRDHLEERLSELMKSGKSREEAIGLAMEEFGDVNGLALDLTNVSRTPIRKVIMRSTLAVSVAAACMMCAIVLFVPERPGVPALTVAQQTPEPDANRRNQDANPVRQRVAMLNEALYPAFLQKPMDVEFDEVPLDEVCNFLESHLDVPVRIDQVRMRDAGMDSKSPLTMHLKGVTFEEVLNHITRRANGLYWHVDGGIVEFTTEQHYFSESFDLDRLVRPDEGVDPLIHVIRTTVDSWVDDGEFGSIAVVGNSAVVRQTYQNLVRIAQVLSAIEHHQPIAVQGSCSGREKLMKALQTPCSIDVSNASLLEVIEFLTESAGVPIVLDKVAVEDSSGVPTDITLSLKNRTLMQVLKVILKHTDLTWQVRDGVIWITTVGTAESNMQLVVYNLGSDINSETVDQISNAILRTANARWVVSDGDGGKLTFLPGTGSLIVLQADQVQQQVQDLIQRHERHLKGRGVANAPRSVPEKFIQKEKCVTKPYSMPKQLAVDLSRAIPNLVAPESWPVPVDGVLPMIELVSTSASMEEVDGLVTGGTNEIRVMNPGASPSNERKASGQLAASGQKSIVVHPRSTLVIRQSAEVHRQIAVFLEDLNLSGLTTREIGIPEGREGWGRGRGE